MNEDSTLDKVERVARKFLKWIPAFIFLLIVLGGGYYIYQNSGYKEYRASLSYLNSLSGDKKTYERNRFFAIGNEVNLHGGILAASWDHGILIWGINGLTYYQVGETLAKDNTISKGIHTNLYYINGNGGCAESWKEVEAGGPIKSRFFEDIVTNPFIDLHLHNYKWRAAIHPGNYIQVLTNGWDNKAISATVVAEFEAPKNWVICSLYSAT